MPRRKDEWQIVNEINLYTKQLKFTDEQCRQLKPIMRIRKATAQFLNSDGYTLCYIIGAEEVEGGIKVYGRFVTNYIYEGKMKKSAILGGLFHLTVNRRNGLVIAKVLRKSFEQSKIVRIG